MINIINDSVDPYFNLALEEYLFKSEPDEDFFWVWQNENTIVIGKNQNAAREVNREFVDEKHITVSRRMTGGGAVYHDLGNLNFTFITGAASSGAYDFTRFTAPVIETLAEMGVTAVNQGRNDVTIDGGKFSGNSQYVSGGRILHHGTILFDSDLDMLGKCLIPSKGKTSIDSKKGVASIRSRVTNISRHLPEGHGFDVSSFKKKLLAHIINAYGITVSRKLNPTEMKEAEKLRNSKYATQGWVYGSSPQYNVSLEKYIHGCGTVCFAASVSGGIIKECRFYGDFFGSGHISELETALVGARCEPQSVAAVLGGFDIGYYFNNMTLDVLTSIFY